MLCCSLRQTSGMAYKLASSDSTKMVLTRESATGASIFTIIVGSLFIVIGIGINAFVYSWEFSYILIKTLFPLFGLLAVYGGISMPKQLRLTQPSRITFDHEKGAVVIEMNDKTDQRGYIRYDEVEGFDIHEERRTSSSGSSNTRTRTYYVYHVYLKKKDGGEWHLFQFNTRAKAEELIIQLKAEIQFDKPFTVTEQPRLTSKIEKQEGIDKTVIHWENKVTLMQPIIVFTFGLIFLTMLFSFFTFGEEVEIFGSIVIGFILIIFLFIMFVIIQKMIKDMTTRYAVSVDHTNLEYFEFSRSTGAMRNKKTLGLKDVHSINYTFAPSKNYQAAGLTIRMQEHIGREKLLDEKPIEAIKDLFLTGDKPITLSITALNPVECLQLENWLQELILNKSRMKVR